jgi:hypothetical protein
VFLDKIEGSVFKALGTTEALFGRVDARIATYLSQIIAMTYNVSVKVEQNPELYKVELVNAGTLARLLPGFVKYAFDVFSKYIRGQATKQFIEIITKDEDLSGKALEKSRHKDENKSKSKPAESTTVWFGGGLEPDPDDEENHKKKRYKYTNYEKGEDIGIDRFAKRINGHTFEDPKSGQYIQKDRALNSGVASHGPSHWKLFDRFNKLVGTISENGIFFKPPKS